MPTTAIRAGSTTASWPTTRSWPRLAGERGIAFVDIFDISLRAAEDRSLVADDGLHPSGAQYGLWVERIAPVVEGLLGGLIRPERSAGRPQLLEPASLIPKWWAIS